MRAAQGYALPRGSGGAFVKVEISVDGGKSWKEAELVWERGNWSWKLWGTLVEVAGGASVFSKVRAYCYFETSLLRYLRYRY